MKNTIEFDGMETSIDNKVDFLEHFDEGFGDAEITYIGKKEFTHEEEGLNFKYRYVVRVIDMEEFTGEENEPIYISLELVVSPENLHDKRVDEIKSSFGLEDEEGYEITYVDITDYGNGVVMAEDSVEAYNEAELNLKLDAVASMYQSIDSLRGFHLDRPWNQVGTNGWDTLNHVINDTPLFNFG